MAGHQIQRMSTSGSGAMEVLDVSAAQALNVDADHLGDGATAVTTEDVPAPHRVLFAGVMVLDPRRYAIAVLLQPDELMMKPDLARI